MSLCLLHSSYLPPLKLSWFIKGVTRHVMTILQRMIDCRDMSEDTVAWGKTNKALQVARETSVEHALNNREGRNVHSNVHLHLPSNVFI
ncbi:hypothetical protein LR48_Vigan05g116900 [Vigna angularis]|uniref:Uncharacterized protein n=1 Tax=Phaseolus angularis TaxID=3914 RepID=A0A0L9ULX8_PHAAN|nr:hypothetical protein LR48_Vigan05g116900 [Vigna angularis]